MGMIMIGIMVVCQLCRNKKIIMIISLNVIQMVCFILLMELWINCVLLKLIFSWILVGRFFLICFRCLQKVLVILILLALGCGMMVLFIIGMLFCLSMVWRFFGFSLVQLILWKWIMWLFFFFRMRLLNLFGVVSLFCVCMVSFVLVFFIWLEGSFIFLCCKVCCIFSGVSLQAVSCFVLIYRCMVYFFWLQMCILFILLIV